MMLSELQEIGEHVASLADEMASGGRMSEGDFKVQVGHIYAHLNRLWNGRALCDSDLEGIPWSERSAFPTDISPMG